MEQRLENLLETTLRHAPRAYGSGTIFGMDALALHYDNPPFDPTRTSPFLANLRSQTAIDRLRGASFAPLDDSWRPYTPPEPVYTPPEPVYVPPSPMFLQTTPNSTKLFGEDEGTAPLIRIDRNSHHGLPKDHLQYGPDIFTGRSGNEAYDVLGDCIQKMQGGRLKMPWERNGNDDPWK